MTHCEHGRKIKHVLSVNNYIANVANVSLLILFTRCKYFTHDI